jgi:hypothetical protein
MTSHRTVAFPFSLAALIVATLLVIVAPAGHARVSAVGLVDYTKKNFKVGDWVRYRVDVSNDLGNEDMNFQEVRIVGEDAFRGEKCFWIETWYGPDSLKASYDLALVSYDVFKDPDSDLRYQLYVRMVLYGMDDEGIPELVELRPSTASKDPDLRPLRGQIDTLGIEPVATAKGSLDGRLIQLQRKLSNPRQMADSTVNRITDMVRRTWVSRKIPVTSVVKEEEVNKRLVQSYAVGQPSTSAPENMIETLYRTATVVNWGTGARSEMLETWRKYRGFMRPNSQGTGLGIEDPTDMPR